MAAGEYLLPIPSENRGRPRSYHADRAASSSERDRKRKAQHKNDRIERIAILDMETDPFDKEQPDMKVLPFAACLFSDCFETIVIWDDDYETFVQRLLDALGNLEGSFTIYAHNGGKFDYMFLMHKLRGSVSFKGRGIMCAHIGSHEIRDSFHIIPEKLANYHKEQFDYDKMRKDRRADHRQEIIDYLVSDCEYLFEIVKDFLTRFGFKLSIGQAAIATLKKHYKVKSIGQNTDATLRQWFFGGRVECLAGAGHWQGDYKLYDVNSMYPYVMANFEHPISDDYTLRRSGGITKNTVFLEVECRNYGALVRRSENNGTTATERFGTFLTTIWEFETALELGLIDYVNVKSYLDNAERSNFSKFVEPLYLERQETKERLKTLSKTSREYFETKREDIFLKLLLNNAYGKFAQNPRRFKEHYLTDPGERPEDDSYAEILLPHFECDDYWIWQRPAKNFRFHNVGTAASITGAARSVLMRAIHNAIDPIYCDTDSIICRNLHDVEIDKIKLGAWDLEAEFSEVIICGKKLYATKPKGWTGQEADIRVKSKGSTGLTWADMLAMLRGEIIPSRNTAPTLDKFGKQYYITRNIAVTAKQGLETFA